MDQQMESKLRVLHQALYQALDFPDLSTGYTNFVRSLRERYHPVGVRDVRIAELASGLKFQVDLGDRLGADVYYGYYQEYFDAQLLLSLIHPGATVLDIGANFGYYALSAGTKVGKDGLVLAFEPNPEAYELLERNTQINQLESIVQCHQACLGATDGETDFYLTEESSFSGIGATGRAKIKQQVRIPLHRLDSFLERLQIPTIDVMKIDVEGYEFAVLESAQTILENSPDCVIMLEVSAKNLDQHRLVALIEVLERLYRLGFQAFRVNSTELTPLKTPAAISEIGAANLFLTSTNSSQHQELQDSYQRLRRFAFQGIAPELNIVPEPLLWRHSQDPLGYSKLHGALLDACLRDRQGRIEAQNRDIQRREVELTKLKAEISRLEAKLKAEISRLEAENQALKQELNLPLRAKIIRKLRG
ncbi:FkbM family methyltransferase [Gloeocapsa sp. PCC 73106]|uniref:FkbM family methyltransferase n=1 Tax=Gloeocapsa sp. PCC 73106 TaxID=102232 RepID=UPI0002AD0AF7|nr:FkbM family methyltransferase [Gloeocapsa sp. PCC 73106]ELR99204.1 methyltransferase, FkbM family [Gloeocapsa sp. PCC 73106]